MIRDAVAGSAFDIKLRQTARHGIEACGQRDNIKLFIMARLCTNALLREFGDGIGADVDEVDVREVVDFVVLVCRISDVLLLSIEAALLYCVREEERTHVLLKGWTLQPESVGRLFRRKNGSFGRVVNTSLDIGSPEFVSLTTEISCKPEQKWEHKTTSKLASLFLYVSS